ncbi:hypothetical protein CE655_25130 [Salmonella enterica]|nr:hypothetical protein [Salmonella enterica]
MARIVILSFTLTHLAKHLPDNQSQEYEGKTISIITFDMTSKTDTNETMLIQLIQLIQLI